MGSPLGLVVVLAVCARSAAPSQLVSETERESTFCVDVGVHENVKDREGYGNQLHALILAAEVARACDLRLVIPHSGRLGHVCSRLGGCRGATVDRRDYGRPPTADFEIVYMPGYGARCHAKKTRACVLRNATCLAPLAAPIADPTGARALLDVSRPPLTAACSDGRPAPATFDVTLHARAITTAFEGRDEALFRLGRDAYRARAAANATDERDFSVPPAILDLPPFEELVAPLAALIRARRWRRTVFLAANLVDVKRFVAARLAAAGLVVCAVDASADELRHPARMGNDRQRDSDDATLCKACLDVTFSEWAFLARAERLVAQIGMHCLEPAPGAPPCADPRERILGRRSSFSLTAATVAGANTTILVGDDVPPLSPPGRRPESGLAHACSATPVLRAAGRAGVNF